MQTKAKKPIVQEVRKPILTGSWHGKDAWRHGMRYMLTVLLIGLIYLLACSILGFDSLAGRIVSAVVVVGGIGYYQYLQGMSLGTKDAALGETMYVRQAEGKPVSPKDRERCFHPFKGFFIALVGALPFVLFCAVFACITRETTYALGVLPSWTEGMLLQEEFGDALRYYTAQPGVQAMDVLRIIDRALIMPFASIGAYLGNHAALVVERLSPVLVLLAPMAYALGYAQGEKARIRVNTAIQLGDDKKKRRERKARKQRQQKQQQCKQPERLI